MVSSVCRWVACGTDNVVYHFLTTSKSINFSFTSGILAAMLINYEKGRKERKEEKKRKQLQKTIPINII